MIIETHINGRPALASFLDAELKPMDEDKAAIVEVIFTDEQNGTIWLVPKAHADSSQTPE